MDYNLFSNFLNFKNKIVVITGCNSPLGNEISKFYLDAGATVIGLDLILKKNDFIFYKCDITKERNVNKIFNLIFNRFKKIDILINNAAKAIFDPFEKRNTKDLDDVINVNLKGTFYCINSFSKFSSNNAKRNIVNISSIYSLISPDPGIYSKGDRKSSEIYGATKSGINQMTKYFSVHLAKKKIRVNSVSPGGIYNIKNPQTKTFIKKYSKKNPMNRMANVCEIVGAIVYLTSDTSSYTTGHNIIIDGGMSAW
jgi:NAD(P)-dependent dehydrogenase (short-subunit alcohol dehydrogenase family)